MERKDVQHTWSTAAFGIKAEIRKAKPYVKLNKADIANNLALRKSQEKCTRLCFGIGGPIIEYSSRVKINIWWNPNINLAHQFR